MHALPTSHEQLRQWLEAPEGSRFEFKSATQNYHFEKLVEYCVALANEGGGKIILGATDRRPRQVCGTAAFSEPGRTEAGLYDRLRQRIPIEEVKLPEGRVLVVHVPPRLPGAAWQIEGRYLKRAGDDLVAMTADELRDIFAEIGPDFSAQPCPGATLKDLAPEAIQEFQVRWAKKARDERRLAWSDEEVLNNAELRVEDQLTYAALILFGTRAALGRHLAQAEVVFEYRPTEASGPAADREEYREGFFLFHDALWNRINLRNDRQSYQEGLFRIDLLTFDEVPVREALLNAVAHRDYRLGGSVFVRQYPRRMEVVSPGGFPPGITLENLLDQQNPRNRRLAEALAKCGLIERSGQGVNLMVESAIRQGKELPDFTGSSSHEVRLVLPGTVQYPAMVRFLEKVGDARLQGFSTLDFLVLEGLYQDKPLTKAMKERLAGLVEAGAVESVGQGRSRRFILSKALYASLGAKGVHTRKRGLDHETNKALLFQHLKNQGDLGAPLSELEQVLPSLPEHKIRGLLYELKEENTIVLQGTRRWARWKVTPKTQVPPDEF
jgi:ATP-dependent DNA helicase RecG